MQRACKSQLLETSPVGKRNSSSESIHWREMHPRRDTQPGSPSGKCKWKSQWDAANTPVTKVKIKKSDNSNCWWGCEQLELTHTLLVGMRNSTHSPSAKSLTVSCQSKRTFMHDPSIPFLDNYCRATKAPHSTKVYSGLFIIVGEWKQPRVL